MFGITDIYLFIIAGLLLNITPGADMLYILSNTFAKGFKAGVVAVLGINAGCLLHVFLVVIGLSAILKTSVIAFTVVKYVGVVYLIYLGITMLLKSNAKNNIKLDNSDNSKSLKKIFKNGALINSLNPKVAIFFITFLPQFIDVNASNQSMGLLILGLIFIFVGMTFNIILAYFSLKLSSKLTCTGLFISVLKKAVGSIFIAFGIKLAMEP